MSAHWVKFYRVYRYTSLLDILSLLVKQFCFYSLVVLAFVGIFRSVNIQVFTVFKYLLFCLINISLIKILSFYVLKGYRSYLKGNVRNVVLVGSGDGIEELKNIFISSRELGYRINAVFSDKNDTEKTGTITDALNFLASSKVVDEIYCAIDVLTEKQINAFVQLANLNHCNIKFVPNRLKLATKRLKTDYYGFFPVLSIDEPAINNPFNRFVKRFFDVLLSIIVILFILPWVT
ncbi:MAG: nucleoside-diphosphate sugar epimerase/dehydratase, partial [Jejuia sp.]